MEYLDPYNHPTLAIREYEINGGEITPNLFNGTIFRVRADQSFTLERLKNQIDGAKFFLEIYNTSVTNITVTFNEDYRGTNLGEAPSVILAAGEVVSYDMICRVGLMLILNVEGGLTPEEEGDTILWDDGVSYFRLQVRTGSIYLDQVIGGSGFEGVEGVNWDNIWSKALP